MTKKGTKDISRSSCFLSYQKQLRRTNWEYNRSKPDCNIHPIHLGPQNRSWRKSGLSQFCVIVVFQYMFPLKIWMVNPSQPKTTTDVLSTNDCHLGGTNICSFSKGPRTDGLNVSRLQPPSPFHIYNFNGIIF